MAPKSTKAGTPARNLSAAQLKRIWDELPPGPLLARLRQLQPKARWTASGKRLCGCCPFHEETNPSFNIYLDRGYAKCYGCEKFLWNPVELWAAVTGKSVSWADAFADLRQQFGLRFLTGGLGQQLKGWERNQLVKKRIAAICHDTLISAISEPRNPDYAYAQSTVSYLVNTRKMPVVAFPLLPMLGIIPPTSTLVAKLDLEAAIENKRRQDEALQNGTKPEPISSLAPDALAYFQAAAGWTGSILFRLDIAPDTIGRLKIRQPASGDKIFIDDAYDDDIGFMGLGWPQYTGLYGNGKKYAPHVYLVEGDFDALSIMARQVEAGAPTFIVVGAGGKSTTNEIDHLHSFGFEEIFLVADAPSNSGDKLIAEWLPRIRKLRSKVFIGYGDYPAQANDPDAIVVTQGLAVFQNALLRTKDPTQFQTPQEWVFDHASPSIEQHEPSDLRARIEAAAEWGRLLSNPHEGSAYVELCATTYGIPSAQLKREIVARGEDEPGFILRLVDVLQQHFQVIGQRALDNDRRLYLFHRAQGKMIILSLATGASIERELGASIGPAYQFFNERVGIPPFLEKSDATKEKGQYLQKQDESLQWYLRQALMIMAQNANDFDNSSKRGQGIHVIRNETEGGPPSVYVVNGRVVYHGSFDESGAIVWQKLDGPAHGTAIFEIGLRHSELPWLEHVHDVEDLVAANRTNLAGVWQRLHAVLDCGWTFKNHAVTVDFLTAHIMAASIGNAFRRQVVVAFHADTGAGKSKLVRGLLGGREFPRIHVLAAAIDMPNFSAAGIRQQMNNKTRPLCLDEFEDKGGPDKRGKAITETLEMLRSLTGENNTFQMGSRSGEPVHYNLNFFVFLAAINKARQVQDANRMVTVYMDRTAGRDDPVNVIMDRFGIDYMQELKKDLSTALLPSAARIHAGYAELEKEFSKAGSKPANVDARMFEALFPALTIMKLLGRDYSKFVVDFCHANREILMAAATSTDSTLLFDWLCQSPKLKHRIGDNRDRNDATLLQLLATPEGREEINTSGSGLFYDAETQVIIVNWIQAQQVVLAGHPTYSKESNISNIREIANRAPNALKPDVLLRSGALTRLRMYGLASIPVSQLTAYSVAHIIKSIELPVAAPAPVSIPAQPIAKVIDDADFGT